MLEDCMSVSLHFASVSYAFYIIAKMVNVPFDS